MCPLQRRRETRRVKMSFETSHQDDVHDYTTSDVLGDVAHDVITRRRRHRGATSCAMSTRRLRARWVAYVKSGSAHPKHCFKGIVKDQLLRLRRLCSRDSDFFEAVSQLRNRCLNSGYSVEMVDNILQQAHVLQRNLTINRNEDVCDINSVRWVILSGTPYEKQIEEFARRINTVLLSHKIKLEIIHSTGSTLGNILFQNNIKSITQEICSRRCDVCSNDLRNQNTSVVSPTNGRSYPIDRFLGCSDGGIYCIACSCMSLYVGKTTNNQRFKEHFSQSRNSAILEHSKV